MKFLVIGGGGREHALVWALNRSPHVHKVFAAPGNGGIAEAADCVDIDPVNSSALVNFAIDMEIDFTIVGPEAPLVAGVADAFADAGLALFGPDRHAARLEGSKSFSKQFMTRHEIPTAEFVICEEPSEARAAARGFGQAVVKADGLAGGKGVFVTGSVTEADEAIERLMIRQEFGEAGLRVVVERRLRGKEVSVMVVSDGEHFVILPPARDYKRLETGDLGPNTGGMGVVSPVIDWTPAVEQRVIDTIIVPTLQGMKQEGTVYRGVLYVGLMLCDGRPYVLEYNCRFGDPETQVVMPRLDVDVAELVMESIRGTVGEFHLSVAADSAVGVVLASGGYPHRYPIGLPISGLESTAEIENLLVFHSGTEMDQGRFVTAGGRVLTVVGLGHDVKAAAERAYRGVDDIEFEGKQSRVDIGQ